MDKIAGSIDAIIWVSKVMGAATLGSVFENYRLNATCHDCGQSKELDVGPLKDKFGEDFKIPRLNKCLNVRSVLHQTGPLPSWVTSRL